MNARWISAVVLIVLGFGGAARAQARGDGAPEVPSVSPAELQRLFDAYSIVQAQEFLKLGDEQYARFLPRFKALLDTRRQTLQQRTRVLNVVRRLVMDAQPDEGMLRDALKQLQEIDTRGEGDARRAYDAIDQVLDLKQQAKFRVFEEQMERRKLAMVTQAQINRQQLNRQNRQQQKLP
jgi:hypothetical protein